MNYRLLVLIFALPTLVLGVGQTVYGQCLSGGCNVSASASATQICPGQSVTLTGIGNTALLNNNFNDMTLGAGWFTNNNVVNFNSPCGPSLDNTPHVWFGSAAGTGTRMLQTVDFDMTAGGMITFDMRFALQSATSPCEGPDEADEGVSLQYSINNGTTWVDITYFSPSGVQLATNPLTNTVVANGPTAFTSWATYSFTIPPAAQAPCTRFRWFQPNNTSATNDHWGIDNVFIGQPSVPGTTAFEWVDNGAPGNVPRVETPTVTTDYVLMFATPTDTCYDTVTVTVLNYTPLTVDAGPDRVICPNSSQTFAGIITGGVPPYTAAWFYPGGGGTNPMTMVPTPATAGNYVLTVSHFCEPSVFLNDTLLVTIGPPQFQVGVSVDSISCFGTHDGAIDATVTGQIPPFTYLWTPGNAVTPDISDLGLGTYSLTVTDSSGCQVDTSITLTEPTNISMGLTDRFVCSEDSVSLLPNPLPGVVYTWSPASHVFDTTDASPLFYGENTGPADLSVLVTVEATSPGACGSDSFLVHISALPQVQLGLAGYDTLALCNNDTLVLANALSNAGFPAITAQQWQDNTDSTHYATNTPGTYWLKLTNTTGCTAIDSIELVAAAPPSVTIDSAFYTCGNDPVTLFATGYVGTDNLLWSTGAVTDSIQVSTGGVYTLIVSNQCASDTATTQLIQIPLVETSDLKNIFTPNGDGQNDVYTLGESFQHATGFSAFIMNRWGGQVFKTEDYQVNWAPKNISDGVYFLAIVYTDCQNEVRRLGQTITVTGTK